MDDATLLAAVRRATGDAALPLRAFPWWLTKLAAPFSVLLRELREMRYLWREPLQLDNRRLQAWLGEEPHTPVVEALREALAGLDALPRPISLAAA